MLRLLGGTTTRRILPQPLSHKTTWSSSSLHPNRINPYRTFFWSNKNDDDDDNDNKKKDDPKKDKEQNRKTADEPKRRIPWTGVRANNSSPNGNHPSTKGGGGGGSGGVYVPSRTGYGDESPRYPHLVGLPVVTRPLFPGIVTSVNITDPTTIDAMEKATSGNGAGYVGVFLRKDSGTTENGVILPTPEVITDPTQLYKVGTFAQVYKVNRSVGLNPSALHAPTAQWKQQQEDEKKDDDDNTAEDEPKTKSTTTASLLLMAHRRINLISIDNVGPPIDVTVRHWDPQDYNPNDNTKTNDTIRALTNEILSTIREVAQLSPLFREHLQLFPVRIDANDPYRLADFVASVTTGTPEELQAILEEPDAERRLHKALVLLSKEREVSKLQQEISAKVEEKMTEAQRKYFLTEQLKSIKKELGMEQDDKEAVLEKYRSKLKEYPAIPTEVMEVMESEMEKLSTLEKNSSEFNVTRSYLDWLTSIPWGVLSDETFDIRDARNVLDRDHYGLEDVKDIVLQFIAVGKLKGTVQGKILCLVGPPGTGKTSIASSVADALGRKFYRFSVGGLHDVSEIKGHRRTYIGAMPGKIIQCLKTTGTTNPLVLIDEIDKLGRDFRGDPASALLEVLDPSQNSSFRDHFLDVPVDVSKVLFMCTANNLETIPGPLLDRMEIVQLSGYDVPEKLAIAEQYLVPKSMVENGLMIKQDEKTDETSSTPTTEDSNTIRPTYTLANNIPPTLSISTSAIESLVRWYCREAGVRNLFKHIDKIARKLALQVVAETESTELTDRSKRKSDTWTVSESNLHHYVGKPLYTSDRMYEKDPLPHGIVMGLAWTSMGGSALYIETQAIKRGKDKETGKLRGGGNLKCTGQLGDVMSESTQIAYTVARAVLSRTQSCNDFYDEYDVHMHVPEGATPKDGPSAGITMVTAMLSLALEKPIGNDLAMTGEISLTGKVLPVGGIKEKTMAARRAGIKCLIFPEGNKRDFEELPEYLKEGLEVHFAEEYDQVYDVVFGDGCGGEEEEVKSE